MNVNNQLGIPVLLHEYDNFTHIDSDYADASGRRQRRQERRAERKERRQERRQERRENRNTQRVTEGDRRAAEQWVMNSFGNQLLEAKTLDQIDYWAGVMADQKVDMEMMLGKRKSGVGNVLSFGRQYKRRGKNAGLCTNDGCIRQSQARLDALNQFEVRHNTAITTLRKKLEKQMEEKPPVAGNTTPSIPTAPMPSAEQQGGIMIGGEILQPKDTPKDAVLIGGKEIKKSTLIFGAVGLGIVGILYFKLR